MDPERTILAPSTVKKSYSSKVNTFNGPLSQIKFRILNSAGSTLNCVPHVNANTAPTNTNTITATTSKIPAKSYGLAKPTSVKQIIQAASTTSSTSLRPPARSLSSSSSSSSSRIATTTTTSKLAAPVRSANVRKPTALQTTKQSAQSNASNGAFKNILTSSSTSQKQQQQQQQGSLNDQIPDITSIFNSVTGEVGEIRKLLEQLLNIIQGSHETQESLIEENQRLKKENKELRERMQSVKRTVFLNKDTMRLHDCNRSDVVIHEESTTDSAISSFDSKGQDSTSRASVYSTPMI